MLAWGLQWIWSKGFGVGVWGGRGNLRGVIFFSALYLFFLSFIVLLHIFLSQNIIS